MTSAAEVAAASPRSRRMAGAYMICCPAHDDRTPSCKVWDGPKGDALFHCFGGCDWKDVKAAAVSAGLITDTATAPLTADQLRKIERQRREREAKDRARREKQWRAARAIWRATRPIAGTPAAAYLTARGIRPPFPASLRFVPMVKHPTVHDHSGPAMVARVQSCDGRGLAVHVTFLDGAAKADIDPCKVIIGPARTGAVHLGEPQGALALAEGIETALAVNQSTGIPTWAALSASLLGCLALPPPDTAPSLYIAPDGDTAGLKAARKLADSAGGQYAVRVVPAPNGFDWNDVLRGVAA